MTKAPVHLTRDQKAKVLHALLEKAESIDVVPVCIGVSTTHVHFYGRFASGTVRTAVGRMKRHSSLVLRSEVVGKIWGKRCAVRIVHHEDHARDVVRYIRCHERTEGAAVWWVGADRPSVTRSST
jgi:hypothetical protein